MWFVVLLKEEKKCKEGKACGKFLYSALKSPTQNDVDGNSTIFSTLTSNSLKQTPPKLPTSERWFWAKIKIRTCVHMWIGWFIFIIGQSFHYFSSHILYLSLFIHSKCWRYSSESSSRKINLLFVSLFFLPFLRGDFHCQSWFLFPWLNFIRFIKMR